MKQHGSVFLLMARATLHKALGLLALMAAVEGGLFWLTLRRGPTDSGFGLEGVVQNSRIVWVFGVCFLLLFALLAWTCRRISGTDTARRLSVGEVWVVFWQSVYNVLCCLLFWAAQILTAIALCRLYAAQAPAEYVTNQTVFLAFYRSEFLHSILPFEDAVFWVRNALLALALGVSAARRPGRRDRALWAPVFLAVSAGFFHGGIGDGTAGLVAAVLALAVAIPTTFRKQEVPFDEA